MKKKSKGKKTVKKQVKNTPAVSKFANLPDGWFYMSSQQMDVKILSMAFEDGSYETEVWKEAGVLEIIIADKISVDVEACDLDLGDEFSNDYLADHQVKSLFYVTFKKDAYELCLPALKFITAKYGGTFCGDTEDFTPVIE